MDKLINFPYRRFCRPVCPLASVGSKEILAGHGVDHPIDPLDIRVQLRSEFMER